MFPFGATMSDIITEWAIHIGLAIAFLGVFGVAIVIQFALASAMLAGRSDLENESPPTDKSSET